MQPYKTALPGRISPPLQVVPEPQPVTPAATGIPEGSGKLSPHLCLLTCTQLSIPPEIGIEQADNAAVKPLTPSGLFLSSTVRRVAKQI